MSAHERAELDRLLAADAANNAKDSLEGWCRYIAPDEPPARHHRLLIGALEQVERGEIKRLMVFMPPGHAKSKYASERFPAWWTGRSPKKAIIATSYGDDLASRFGRRVRNLVASEEYRAVFGHTLAKDSAAQNRWETSEGCEYFAAGVGTGITGRRADLGLIDDPIKGREEADSETVRNKTWEWYLSDFRTRLKPGAAIILIQTRWHEDDLAGRILPDDYDGHSGWYTAKDGERWYVLSLQAICEPITAEDGTEHPDPLNRRPGEALWPEWMSSQMLEQERVSQGSRNWGSLYQQVPKPLDGNLFKPDNIKIVEALPLGLRMARGWDFAATEEAENKRADWTAAFLIGRDPLGRFYICDVDRFRGTPLQVEQRLSGTAATDGSDVLISLPQDPGQAGKAQAQALVRLLAGYQVEATPETGSKVTRAAGFAAQVEAGNVFMLRAPWNRALIDELRAFPSGTYDDQVDAGSRAFHRLISGKNWAF